MPDKNQRLLASDWAALIEECSKSSESQAKFCKRKGLRYTSFCYWRSRLKLKKAKSKPTVSFKEASIIPLSNEAHTSSALKEISIHLGDKLKLVCDISLLPETLTLLKPLLEEVDVKL